MPFQILITDNASFGYRLDSNSQCGTMLASIKRSNVEPALPRQPFLMRQDIPNELRGEHEQVTTFSIKSYHPIQISIKGKNSIHDETH